MLSQNNANFKTPSNVKKIVSNEICLMRCFIVGDIHLLNASAFIKHKKGERDSVTKNTRNIHKIIIYIFDILKVE
jgi:hypothetical protein